MGLFDKHKFYINQSSHLKNITHSNKFKYFILLHKKLDIISYSISQTKISNMGGLTPFELEKILKAIKDCTSNIRFSQILLSIKEQNVFRWPINPIYELSKKGIFDLLVTSCYRLTMLKVVYESLKTEENMQCLQDPSTMIEMSKQTDELNKIIKQQYCLGLQKIPQRKSENMEFLFFLICFSVKNQIFSLTHDFLILKKLFQAVQQNDFLQNQACSMINFEITGIWVRPNLYRYLKKKYYQRKLEKNHRKAKSAQDLVSVFQFLAPVFEQITGKKQKQNSQQKKFSDFRSQLKQIFEERVIKQEQKPYKRQQKYIKLNKQPQVFKEIENENTHLFSLASLRNSNAFMEQRKNYIQKKSKRKDSTQISKLWSSKGETLNKKNEKKSAGLNSITASLKLFFSKVDRKNPVRGAEKYSVQKWKNKIKTIRCQGSLERVTLMNRGEKWRKQGHVTEEEEKPIQGHKFISTFNKQTNNKSAKSERKSNVKKGFCEFIDTRQPSQIGIVRSIVNFSNTLPQPKYKKISSKDLKNQYQEFNRKVFEHQENSLNQNNYMYRLQKALTGTNKL